MADASLWDDMRDALGPVSDGDVSQDDTIAGMARLVLSAAPPTFVAVGFSMGGYVAREVTRMAPDRVRALVLIATSARGDTRVQAQRKTAAALRVGETPFSGLSRSAVASSLHPDRAGDAEMVERIRAMGIRLGGDVFVRQSNLRRDGDLDRLAEIHCPTLVVAAAQDRLRSIGESEELRDSIPGATMQIVDPSGHMIPLEAPEGLAAIMVTWLRALP
jgi:pimeloyl-ACP methyl ester carboxylesterase